MIRAKKKSADNFITNDIPSEYIGKDLEIFIYTSEEIKENIDEKTEMQIVSEPRLAKEWSNEEEDEAWKDL